MNALGRKVWVRESAGGVAREVAPGDVVPRVGVAGAERSDYRGDGGFDPGVDRRDRGDSSDVSSHRGDEPRGDRGGRERTSRGARVRRVPDAVAYRAVRGGDRGGGCRRGRVRRRVFEVFRRVFFVRGTRTESVARRRRAAGRRAVARARAQRLRAGSRSRVARLARVGVRGFGRRRRDARNRNRNETGTGTGTGFFRPPGGVVVEFAAADLLRAATPTPGPWARASSGEWIDLGEARVRVRARLVEGLDLRSFAAPETTAKTTAKNPSPRAKKTPAPSPSSDPLPPLRLYRVGRLELAWWSRDCGSSQELSAWTPARSLPPGVAALGACVVPSLVAPAETLVVDAPWLLPTAAEDASSAAEEKNLVSAATAPASGFELVWKDSGSRFRKNPGGTLAAWRAIAPAGYVAVGFAMTPSHAPPDPSRHACVRADLARPCAPAPAPLWRSGSGAREKLGATQLCVFRAGTAGGQGWVAKAGDPSVASPDAFPGGAPFEIRWEAEARARVEDEAVLFSFTRGSPREGFRPDADSAAAAARASSSSSSSSTPSSASLGPYLALAPNGPWAAAGCTALGASDAAAAAVGPGRRQRARDRSRARVRPRAGDARVRASVRDRGEARQGREVGGEGAARGGEEASPWTRRPFRRSVGVARVYVRVGAFFPLRRVETAQGPARRILHRALLARRRRVAVDVALPGRAAPRGVALGRAVAARLGERRLRRRRARVGVRRQLGHEVAAAPGVESPRRARDAAPKVGPKARPRRRRGGRVPRRGGRQGEGRVARAPGTRGGARRRGRGDADAPRVRRRRRRRRGDEFLALDVRARWVGDDDENASAARKNQNRPRVSRWSRDADAGGGELVALGELEWPIPAGALGRVDAVRNALGPWLAAFAPDDEGESLGDVASSRRDFAIFVAERDEDVSFAGASNDDVRARTNDDHRSSEHASPSPARESAWRLTAHAPVTLRTALPCDCAYALRYENGRVAAEGVLVAGVAERVTRADPRASLSLELVPIVADAGDAAWTCASPAPMPAPPALGRGGVRRHPSAERDAECRVSIVGGRKYEHLFDAENDDASRAALTTALTPSATKPAVSTVRLAVTCERVCATRVGSAPAPLTVDIRAPTAVANGCAFAMVCGAAPPSAGSALVSVAAGSQTLAPGESDETIASRRREHPRTKGGDIDGIAPPDLRRVVWIAPADDATLATLGSAAFRRVEATAGAPPTRVALAFAAPKRFRTDEEGEKEDAREKEEEGDSSFAVEVAAVARAWAPRGVSAASPRPCVRVALVPTLSATNLSDRTLRVRFRDDWETTEARCAGAAPRAFSVDVANRCSEPRTTLAPGAGPVAVRRSAAALASAIERRRAREERGARRSRGAGKTRKTRTPTRSARRTPTISGTTRAPRAEAPRSFATRWRFSAAVAATTTRGRRGGDGRGRVRRGGARRRPARPRGRARGRRAGPRRGRASRARGVPLDVPRRHVPRMRCEPDSARGAISRRADRDDAARQDHAARRSGAPRRAVRARGRASVCLRVPGGRRGRARARVVRPRDRRVAPEPRRRRRRTEKTLWKRLRRRIRRRSVRPIPPRRRLGAGGIARGVSAGRPDPAERVPGRGVA